VEKRKWKPGVYAESAIEDEIFQCGKSAFVAKKLF